MGNRFSSILAGMAVLLCLASNANAQTLTPGSTYRVTARGVSGVTATYCYRMLEGNVFEVATTTLISRTSTGIWNSLPTPGLLAATFFQASITTPVSTNTYIGSAYIDPGTSVSVISGTVLTDVAGTIVPSVFTGAVDPTCAH